MRKRKAVLMAAAALAAGMLSCGLAVRPYLDPASGRYPRSQEVSAQELPFYLSANQFILVRKSTDQTTDTLPLVRAWYVRRLQILASENVEPPGGNCVWMARSRHMAFFHYSSQVLLCNVPLGTRINLEESVALGP